MRLILFVLAAAVFPQNVSSASDYKGAGDKGTDKAPRRASTETIPHLKRSVTTAQGYQRAKKVARAAIDQPDSTALVRKLWDAVNSVAHETQRDVMETAKIILNDSIKEDNETKHMILNKLKTLNKINQALAHSLKSLADASKKLASREKSDETDAKTAVNYLRYDAKARDPAARLRRFNGELTQTQIKREIKALEGRREQLRLQEQKTQNEFRHMDQLVNQQMQNIDRIMRTLGSIRTQTGVGGQKY